MRTPLLLSLSILALPSVAFSQTTADVFDYDVVPAFRGSATAEYAGWDAFTVAFGTGNTPDDGASTLSSSLEQVTPGAIITSTMNIYHPSGSSSFVASAAATGDVQEAIIQLRTFGSPLDASSFLLLYTDAGTVVVVAPSTSQVLSPSGGGAEETLYSFDLSGVAADVMDFDLAFDATGAHCSLDAVMVDVRTGEATIGASYCTAVANSTGVAGETTATGSDSVADNDVTLTASGLPANTFGFFITGQTQDSVAMPGGSQGTLCLGGAIGRYAGNIFQSSAAGDHSLAIDLAQLPSPTGNVAAAAGETWNFQCWFRDANPSATSNFTFPVSITFQ